MSNKSKTYVYPVIFREFNLLLDSNVVNTYLYNNTVPDSFTIVYKFDENSSILEGSKLVQIEKSLRDYKHLLGVIESEDASKIAYIIKRPKHLTPLFHSFEQGNFSKIPEKFKYTVVKHLNRYYKAFPEAIADISSILFKDPAYRERLSEELGYQLSEEMELSSKPDKELETFDVESLNQ